MSIDEEMRRLGVKHYKTGCAVCNPLDKALLDAALSFEGNYSNNRPEKYLNKVYEALRKAGWHK